MIRRFFMRTAARLQSFMYGRYILFGGFDKFSLLLFILGLAASFFGSLFGRGLPAILLAALSLLVYFYLIFRLFSKNISARRRENELFLSVLRKIKSPFTLFKNRIKDRKTHIYRKCPHCKAVLRLPKKKGKNSVICPRCRERFYVKSIFR